MARRASKLAGIRVIPFLMSGALLLGTFFLQAQTPGTKSKTDKPASETAKTAGPKTNAKSPERLQQLLDDVKRARQLLQEKNFEEFAEEYLPIEELRSIRANTTVKDLALNLKKQGSASPQFQSLNLMLERAPTGTWEFFHDDSQVTMTFYLKDYQPKPKTKKPVETYPDAPGLGADLSKALDEAIKLLEAKDVQNFVIKVFPLSEVQPYVDEESEAQAEMAVVLRDNPEMVAAMLADLQALRNLKPKMESGDVATFELSLTIKPTEQLAPNASTKGNKEEPLPMSRQIRFQKVHDHWRFYDHRAEMSKVLSELDVNYDPDAPSTETMSWERFGKRWRLKPHSNSTNPPPPQPEVPARASEPTQRKAKSFPAKKAMPAGKGLPAAKALPAEKSGN